MIEANVDEALERMSAFIDAHGSARKRILSEGRCASTSPNMDPLALRQLETGPGEKKLVGVESRSRYRSLAKAIEFVSNDLGNEMTFWRDGNTTPGADSCNGGRRVGSDPKYPRKDLLSLVPSWGQGSSSGARYFTLVEKRGQQCDNVQRTVTLLDERLHGVARKCELGVEERTEAP